MKELNNETNSLDSTSNEFAKNIELQTTSIHSNVEHPIKHSLSLLKAALPYVGANSKHSVEVMVKATELIDSVNHTPNELATLSLNEGLGDMEGMLNNIKGYCTDQERDLVDMVLNFMKAQKFYNTYKTISIAGQNKKSEESNPYAQVFGFDENVSMMEMLSSMLTPEQKSTFETINMVLSAMPSSMS